MLCYSFYSVVGVWSPWSTWSSCSQTCYDGGTLPNRIRTRTCEPNACYCHTADASQIVSCNTNKSCHGKCFSNFIRVIYFIYSNEKREYLHIGASNIYNQIELRWRRYLNI